MKKPNEEDDDDIPDEEELEEEEQEEEKPIKQLKKIEDKPKSKSSNVERYSLVEVPTQTQVMIRNNDDDKVFDINSSICKIMNDIDIIKRNLV